MVALSPVICQEERSRSGGQGGIRFGVTLTTGYALVSSARVVLMPDRVDRCSMGARRSPGILTSIDIPEPA